MVLDQQLPHRLNRCQLILVGGVSAPGFKSDRTGVVMRVYAGPAFAQTQVAVPRNA